jgi:hypothetical protein
MNKAKLQNIQLVSARYVLSDWSRSAASWFAGFAGITCLARTIIEAGHRCGFYMEPAPIRAAEVNKVY